ncbi:MAG: 2-oxoglutarate and iron-dependent oxygenase domain-containing protein [Ilumatobacter sp.]|uniref:isopenicillin N synthase family dioxygenase n=1 Tax=Ilumatobacter sp. TaxID=1967498 RepID=UPI003C72C07F
MTASGFASIPVVDLSGIDDPARRGALADELCTVCHDVGFAVIDRHGVEPEVIDDVFELMDRFFALDDEAKALIDKRRSPQFRGWEAVGSEFTNNRVDVREQIDVWSEWPVAESTAGNAPSRLLGPNQWMPDDVLSDHRSVTTRWMRELGDLADRILELLATGLGLDRSYFAELFGAQPMSLTKMIHYPPTPDGGAGVNAHHDTGFLTLLAPGVTAGLQVIDPSGNWIDVPSIPGTLVMNLGEMLQAMTGNYFVATPHRVLAATDRMSAAYFHGPSLDTELSPMPMAPRFLDAVAASERHRTAGFMASAEQTATGTGDMASATHTSTYGEQLWNYFSRSYPDNMARHHADLRP